MNEVPGAYDWNPVDAHTNQPQSFGPLIEKGLHETCLAILSWIRGHNVNYTGDQQKLTYVESRGEGFTAFEFRLHDDVVALRTPWTRTYRIAKTICFDSDPTKVRVRYAVIRQVRDPEDILGNRIITQALDMLEVDYELAKMYSGIPGSKKIGATIYNHFMGLFNFDNYRDHPSAEPPIIGKHGFNVKPTTRLRYPESAYPY
jgi:hypothetical protein